MDRPEQPGNRKVIRYNFIANVGDGTLFSFGLSFVSLITVFPILIKTVGGGNISLSLIPVLWTIGFNFPQIIMANRVRTYPFKKKIVLRTALLQRLPWLILAGFTFFLIPALGKSIALAILLGGLLLAAVGGSINLPGWFELISKITPVHLRGSLFALRSLGGALLGITGGWIVKQVLDHFSFPLNFSILFLCAFTTMMLSYLFLAILREPEPSPIDQVFRRRDFFIKIWQILKEDKNFRFFLIADAGMMCALMADAFYTVNALQKFSLSYSFAGIFIMIIMASIITANPIFGLLADNFGHRLNLLFAAGFITLACVVARFAPGIEMYCLVFVASACTASLLQISRLPIIAEICKEKDRSVYVALTNLVTSPFILAALCGGWLANHYGYNLVFMIAGIVALGTMCWLLLIFREPRKQYTLS